jgi:hypothetical protein
MPSPEDDSPRDDLHVEPLPGASCDRFDVGMPSNARGLRTRFSSLLVGFGMIWASTERSRESHLNYAGRGRAEQQDSGWETSISNLSIVPLRQASLCLDCETITTAHTNCHACGSRALLNVARALDQQGPAHLVRARRTAIVQISEPRARQRDTFRRGAPSLGRGRDNSLPLPSTLNLSPSGNSA